MKLVYIIYATCIFLETCAILDSSDSEIRRYASFDDFLTNLKATANDTIDYVTKIQTLLCPDQPVCGPDGEIEKESALRELPEEVTIGNLTMKPENIHNFVGICCLPCSCSDTCWQDDNCCPTKQLFRNKTNTDLARKRCIAASVRSYNIKPSISSYHTEFMYLMTTDCLPNTTNVTLLENCQNPGLESYTNVIPVTSRETGYTYWNRACATCNNDDDDIMEWTSHVIFKYDISYFSDGFGILKLPETIEEVFALLRKPRLGDVIYEPPVPMDNSVCLTRKSVPEAYCEMPPTEIASDATNWLYESCLHLYSPVTKNMGQSTGRRSYRNIFCLICLQHMQLTGQKPACQRGYIDKVGAGYPTALMDYRTSKGETDAKMAGRPQKICGCNNMFDPYLNLCRASYCPAGEFSVGCTCIQVLQNISGMPVLFDINVSAKQRQIKPLNENQLKRLKTALSKALGAIAAHTSVDIPLIFQQANATYPNYIFTVILRSEPGYDTKLSMNPFIKYLDTDAAFDVKYNGIVFLARITSKIRRETWNNTVTNIYYVKNVEQPATTFIQVSSDDVVSRQILLYPGNCQKFSRLLYCKQMQLNESEYFETAPGIITINVTDYMFPITDFYKTPSSNVRVCADEYLKRSKEITRQETSGEATRKCTLGVLMVLVLTSLRD